MRIFIPSNSHLHVQASARTFVLSPIWRFFDEKCVNLRIQWDSTAGCLFDYRQSHVSFFRRASSCGSGRVCERNHRAGDENRIRIRTQGYSTSLAVCFLLSFSQCVCIFIRKKSLFFRLLLLDKRFKPVFIPGFDKIARFCTSAILCSCLYV